MAAVDALEAEAQFVVDGGEVGGQVEGEAVPVSWNRYFKMAG
ncbi:hypothetical protein [Streptomyces sp. NPDC013455]